MTDALPLARFKVLDLTRLRSGPSRKDSLPRGRSRKPLAASVAARRDAVLLWTPRAPASSVTPSSCSGLSKA